MELVVFLVSCKKAPQVYPTEVSSIITFAGMFYSVLQRFTTNTIDKHRCSNFWQVCHRNEMPLFYSMLTIPLSIKSMPDSSSFSWHLLRQSIASSLSVVFVIRMRLANSARKYWLGLPLAPTTQDHPCSQSRVKLDTFRAPLPPHSLAHLTKISVFGSIHQQPTGKLQLQRNAV